MLSSVNGELRFEPFLAADVQYLSHFQPSDWGDIEPRFVQFIQASNCTPIKLVADGSMVAIGTTIRHYDTAWLACIIVPESHRNQGYGKMITMELMRTLDKNTFKTIYLDATNMGFPLYQKLGFQMECEYSHFKKNEDVNRSGFSENILPFHDAYLPQILELDRLVSGEDRKFILQQNVSTARVFVEGHEVQGFYLPDLGEGLIIAANSNAGSRLMEMRITEKPNGAMPSENSVAIAFLEKNGFELFRNSRRMYFGERRAWNQRGIYNRISGQLG